MNKISYDNPVNMLANKLCVKACRWQRKAEIKAIYKIAPTGGESKPRAARILAILRDSNKTAIQIKTELLDIALKEGFTPTMLATLRKNNLFLRVTTQSKERAIRSIMMIYGLK